MTVAGDWTSPAAEWGPVGDSPYAWGVPPKRSRGTKIGLITATVVAVLAVVLIGGFVFFAATASAAGGCGGG